LPVASCCCFRANGQNYIWRQRDHLRCVFASALGVSQGRASVDLQVRSNSPPQLLQSLLECLHPRSRLRVILGEVGEHSRTAHSIRLLRARRERPRRRPAEERNELAPLHRAHPKPKDYGSIAGQGAHRSIAASQCPLRSSATKAGEARCPCMSALPRKRTNGQTPH